ncbi:MAG TPA: putative glycoside hydrolase [Candidatus Paceibacterota bacterium]
MLFGGVGVITLSSLAFFQIPNIVSLSYDAQQIGGEVSGAMEEKLPVVAHIKTPKPVRAVYMTQCVVGTPSFRSELVKLIDETELNSVIIDIKDYSGKLAFIPKDPKLQASVSDKCRASDMETFIKMLHEKDIYVIGRITVFQDPYYTSVHPELAVKKASDGSVWKDHKGLSFVDVSARPFWDYIVAIGKESYAVGFDELNFDYVRFPSDGNMKDIYFSHGTGALKAEALEYFFKYLSEALRPTGAALSADLFGMITTNTDDLNIGQVLERALPYFDFIAPMVYPSHYPKGFNGWTNPNDHVYDVVHFSMARAVLRTIAPTTSVLGLVHTRIGTTTPVVYGKPIYDKYALRPWLQDFDYGGDYDIAEVKAQIQATYDAGLDSWMLWSPSNKYTRGALLSPIPVADN